MRENTLENKGLYLGKSDLKSKGHNWEKSVLNVRVIIIKKKLIKNTTVVCRKNLFKMKGL